MITATDTPTISSNAEDLLKGLVDLRKKRNEAMLKFDRKISDLAIKLKLLQDCCPHENSRDINGEEFCPECRKWL